ncbi:MAG TPA: cobalamin-dependent protein [Bacteroidota bacterium]|nr:cobalamin-dependent protein [Bacteroidota bacterium]
MANSPVQKSYLSTADVSRLFGVTETTVKRWADEGTLRCQKTPGGHRKFEIRHVVEFAEKNDFEPVGALEFSDEDDLGPRIQTAVLERAYPILVDAYIRRALTPGAEHLVSFLSYLYQHRIQLWEIHDQIIRPAMQELGERWSRGELCISQEHEASYSTLEAMARLQCQIRIKPSSGHSVVCATLGDDIHEIGLRCISYLFASEGWETHYLGSRIPTPAVQQAVARWKPRIVCLSATHGDPSRLQESLSQIAGVASGVGAAVLAGGGLAQSLGGTACCIDASRNSSKNILCFISGQGRARPACESGDEPPAPRR